MSFLTLVERRHNVAGRRLQGSSALDTRRREDGLVVCVVRLDGERKVWFGHSDETRGERRLVTSPCRENERSTKNFQPSMGQGSALHMQSCWLVRRRQVQGRSGCFTGTRMARIIPRPKDAAAK